ncbi:MAG: leucine-rich repeat protein [Saccharofermentanales bacterium]|jgi:hypothetical protein
MKRKLYLRIQAFALVLLIMLTTFVVNPQQVQAETAVEEDEESTFDISTTESLSDVEQSDVETEALESPDILPASDNEAIPETDNHMDESLAIEDGSEEITDDILSESIVEPTDEELLEPVDKSTIETEINTSESSEQLLDIENESEQLPSNNSILENISDPICDDERIDYDEFEIEARAITSGRDFEFDPIYGIIREYLGTDSIVNIPSSIDDIAVKFIAYEAFKDKSLTKVTIPDSVTYIGREAFADNQLTSLIIGNSVECIENDAFRSNKLTSVRIPTSVTEIKSGAFENNQLTSIDIPSSIKIIESGTFADNQLRSVVIPNSVTEIRNGAFENNQLTSINIPDSVKYLSGFGWNQLTSVKIPDSVTEIGVGAFYENQLTNIIIPNSVVKIWQQAFHSNQLTNVTLSNKLISIGFGAFENNKLTSIKIPNSVTTIDNWAFASNQLTSINIPDSVEYLSGFDANRLTSVSIPNSVTTIGKSAFRSNKLTSIEIPNSVTKIERSAFYSNDLTKVTMTDNIIEIGTWAFSYNQIASVTIPNTVQIIGTSAFYGNELKRVIIPNSVIKIGREAFKQNPISYASIPDSIIEILSLDWKLDHATYITNPTIDQIKEYCFDPFLTNAYINNGSNIRSTPGGAVIETLKLPIFVTGTIEGDYLKFTHKDRTAYVHLGVTTTSQPGITGYAKSAVNIRNAPGGSIIGTLPIGRQVKGVLVGNMVRFTYNGQTGYVGASLLQGTPVQTTRYIKANSIIRSAPNGSMITKTWRPLLVSGTIDGAWLRFTYNGRTAYVAMSVTTTGNPAMTGYAKQSLYVRNTPNGSVVGTLPKGYRVSGVLVGNMVRFSYRGKTGYVYASLLQGTPVKVTTYIKANSIIRSAPNGSMITKTWRPLFVSGTINGAWLRFTYNGRTAYVAMSVTTSGNPAMTGYAKQKLYVRNTPNGSVVATLPKGYRVSGVLVGNMVRFTYRGKTSYVYATLLQKNP